jgi:hypothetical protein
MTKFSDIEPPDPTHARAAVDLFEQIVPLLRGQHPYVQGLVLADCLALWLAGHFIAGNPDATKSMRESLLKAHIAAVKDLIGPNEQRLVETRRKAMDVN